MNHGKPRRKKGDLHDGNSLRALLWDRHKSVIVACVVVESKKEIRTYRTMTDDLLQFCGLAERGMRPYGRDGKYRFLLEACIQSIGSGGDTDNIGNAQHKKNVPGRKTGVKDAEWVANL
jgi:hypothetical protein